MSLKLSSRFTDGLVPAIGALLTELGYQYQMHDPTTGKIPTWSVPYYSCSKDQRYLGVCLVYPTKLCILTDFAEASVSLPFDDPNFSINIAAALEQSARLPH